MHPLRSASLVFVASAVASACAYAPEPVVRLSALGSNLPYVNGEPVAAMQQDDVRVAVAFAGEREGLLAIRVEVANEGTEAFTFEPTQTYYRALAHARDAAAPDSWHPIVNPEELLLAHDLARSREKADQQSAEDTGAVFALLGVVGTTASLASGNRRAAAAQAHHAAATSARYQQRAANHEARAQIHATERMILAGELLRRSTVIPGQAIAGTVYLKPDPSATRVWLAVRARRAWFRFPFAQAVHWP